MPAGIKAFIANPRGPQTRFILFHIAKLYAYPHWISTESLSYLPQPFSGRLPAAAVPRSCAQSQARAQSIVPVHPIQKSSPPDLNVRRGNLCQKSGGDLLSRLRSTIGAPGLNCSVRNGKRWDPGAVTA